MSGKLPDVWPQSVVDRVDGPPSNGVNPCIVTLRRLSSAASLFLFPSLRRRYESAINVTTGSITANYMHLAKYISTAGDLDFNI